LADESGRKYGGFDADFHDALEKFLEYEKSSGGKHINPAVRAGQFISFIESNHKLFPRLISSVTKDKCEKLLERFSYITLPLDEEPPEPLTPDERHAFARNIAYPQFREDGKSYPTKGAEVMAFADFVKHKYNKTLPNFEQAESQKAVEGWKSKRTRTYAYWALALLFVAGAAGIGNYFLTREKPATPAFKPNKGQDPFPRNPVNPIWNNPPAWNPDAPVWPPADDPELQKKMEEWRRRFDKDNRDGGKKEPGR